VGEGAAKCEEKVLQSAKKGEIAFNPVYGARR
jgi:hypothetical protein